MRFRPSHNRVVVRRIEGDPRMSGGIIVPNTAKEQPMEGEIMGIIEDSHKAKKAA